MTLIDFGWNKNIELAAKSYLSKDQTIARVISEYREQYKIVTEKGVIAAEVSGKLRHQAAGRGDFPAVGDWVLVDVRVDEEKATIHLILPRFSKFSRNLAGKTTDEQIVAANIDTVFLVMALNQDFNVRRLERYLTMAWESGANPVIVLSKLDLCSSLEEKIEACERVGFGVPIHPVSAKNDTGRQALTQYLGRGQTAVFLGSSGAGKSTLTNWLLGTAEHTVQAIREDDDRGRHTTTHRELLILPEGGAIIDTPGMRELQLWTASDESVTRSFSDISALAEHCRFRDCSHLHEPGCEVQAALTDGRLSRERFDSYLKLRKELAFIKRKTDTRARLQEKSRWKKITKSMKNRP